MVFLCCVLSASRTALAIPVFANGQGGVNCGLCHTVVPHLNGYGRYVLMTNFSRGLNKQLQMLENRSLPLALEATGNASSQPDPALPTISNAVTQLMSGGFIGSHVSYFATVPIVSGGFPARAVDQLWLAYDGLSRENGSLQIGKFATPIFAPWISQPLSLTGYGPASMQIGANDSTIADNRWGVSYTQLGHLGLVGNLSYLAGAGPVERTFNSNGEGTAWTGSLQYISPESRWSGGLAGMLGWYPLSSGASDRYTRAAVLASYSGDRYELVALDVVGHDDHPGGRLPAANSNGFSFETIYSPRFWLHFDARYEQTNDGLGASRVNYVAATAFNLRANVILTVEELARVGNKPAFNYQLLWAGPWFRDRFPPGSVPPVSQMTASTSAQAGEIANGRSIFFTGKDSDGVRITANPARVYQSCAVCHGAEGRGGVLLLDGAISARLGPRARMLDAMGSSTQMSNMSMESTPWTIALFERAVSEGVDNNGMELSPVMPRWKMSNRDLHDIALYLLTQIR